MRKRRELEPAKLADRQAQKGNVPIRPRSSEVRGIHSMRGTRRTCAVHKHSVQHRPKVTENGHMERGNPPRALSGKAGEGDQAVSPVGPNHRAVSLGGVGCPKKRKPRVMPGIC